MGRPLAAAALGVALTLAAATFDSPSLYVPGLALAVVSLAALAWVALAARGARVVRSAGPPTVEEESAWPLRLEVRSGILPPPAGDLNEPLLGWPVPLARRRSRRVRINIRFSRRGRRVLAPATVVIRDPLRLYVRSLQSEAGEELIVLPRVEPLRSPGGGGRAGGSFPGGDEQGAGARLHDVAAQLELDALRPYREGTPASRIHWPAVARTGEMLERRLVADADSAPLVVLDASRPGSEEELDQAVRAAASLCFHLAGMRGCGLLLPGDRRPTDVLPDLAAWPASHVRLALVEPGAPRPALSRVRRGGAVIWVTADPAGLPRALERPAGAPVWLVSPHPARTGTAVFEVAGCSGRRVGSARAGKRAA